MRPSAETPLVALSHKVLRGTSTGVLPLGACGFSRLEETQTTLVAQSHKVGTAA
jgi:hypothetical protein